MAARLRTNINRDEVSDPPAAALGNQKPQSAIFALILAVPSGGSLSGGFRDQSESSPTPHVRPQLVSRICNSRGKTSLVNIPESIEIFGPVVADCESHPPILDARPAPNRKLSTISYLPYPGNFSKIYNENVARLHPKSYHSHLRSLWCVSSSSPRCAPSPWTWHGSSSSPITTAAKGFWYCAGWKPPVPLAAASWIPNGSAKAACKPMSVSRLSGLKMPVSP